MNEITILIVFILGGAFALLVNSGKVKSCLATFNESAMIYVLLGVALFLSVWLLGGWGFAVVVVPFVLYQLMGRGTRQLSGEDVGTPPIVAAYKRIAPTWLGGYPKPKVTPNAEVKCSVNDPGGRQAARQERDTYNRSLDEARSNDVPIDGGTPEPTIIPNDVGGTPEPTIIPNDVADEL